MESLGGKKYFSVNDLEKGYYNARLSEESKQYSAFPCPLGHFQSRSLYFWLSIAVRYFSEHMAKVLVGLPDVRVFIDDILIASETFEEHFRDIAEVTKWLSQWGLVVNPKKVRFLLAEVKFLGFICSREGIRVDHEKKRAIAKIKQPRTLT